MDGFKAGAVFLEYEIRTENLNAGFRQIERLSSRSGKISSQNFAKEFAAEKAGKKIGSDFSRGLKSATIGLGAAGKVAGAGFGIAEQIYAVTKSALEAAVEIDQLSTRVGVGAEQFQELRIAAQQFGVAGNDIVGVLDNMNRGVGDLINNTDSKATNALKELELSDDLKSGKLAGMVDIFDAIVDRLGAVKNAQQRATLSAQIFGRENGSKLNTLLNQGSAGIAKAKEEARKLGQVLSGETLASAVSANENLEKLSRTLKTQLTSAILQASPQIEEITGQLIVLIPKMLEWTASLGGFFVNAAVGYEELAKRISVLQLALKTGNFSVLSNNALKTDFQLYEKAAKLAEKLKKIEEEREKIGNKKRSKSNSSLGLDQTEIRKKSLRAEERKLNDELDAVKEVQAQRESQAVSKNADTPTTNKPIPNGNSFSSPKIDQSVITPASITTSKDDNFSKLLDEWEAYIEGVKQGNEELREQGRLLKDQTATPVEQYTAKLAALAAAQSNIFVSEGAGGDETFSRARVLALEELASATGDYEDALEQLIQLNADGKISAESFGQGFQNLTQQMGGAGEALIKLEKLSSSGSIKESASMEARKAIKDSLDYLDDIKKARIEELDIQAKKIEGEIFLAELRGEDVRSQEKKLNLLREEIALIGQGVPIDQAEGAAETFVGDRENAELQGQLKDTFKGAFRAALDGDFEGFLSNKLKNAASNMFDNALDDLFNSLLEGLGGIDGAFGGILKLFAGGFADGGVIGTGRFGLVGENGPELISAGSGPLRITPFDGALSKRLDGMSTNGLESRGSNQTTPSNVVMNISGVKDLGSFVKSQGTIEADMAAAMRRAQADF